MDACTYNVRVERTTLPDRDRGCTCRIRLTCEAAYTEYTSLRIGNIPAAVLDGVAALLPSWEHYEKAVSLVLDETDAGWVYTIRLEGVSLTTAQVAASILAVPGMAEAGLTVDMITVTDAGRTSVEADPNIFVYQAADPADPILDADVFSNVASWYDMVTLPLEPAELEGETPLQDAIPFYRTSSCTLDFITECDALAFVRTAKADIAMLVREYKAHKELEAVAEISF